MISFLTLGSLDQLAGTAQYTDCIYAEGQDYPNACPKYDTKQSDGEVPVMQSTPLIPSLPCPLRLEVVAPDRVLSMDQIELNSVLMLN